MAGPYPNDQGMPAGAIPVYIAPGPSGVVGVGAGAPYTYTPLGYQQLTPLATSTALTPPAGATIAFISVETAGVRYRDDGTAPTATVGMPIAAGQQLTYSGNLTAVRFIAQSGTPVMDVSYYK